jgi:hypothetical protein
VGKNGDIQAHEEKMQANVGTFVHISIAAQQIWQKDVVKLMKNQYFMHM